MRNVRQSKTQQVKRYLVNKMPQMSEGELLVVRAIIDKKLQSIGNKGENVSTDKASEWEMIRERLQSKVRYQLLYNAIQSRLISHTNVSE